MDDILLFSWESSQVRHYPDVVVTELRPFFGIRKDDIGLNRAKRDRPLTSNKANQIVCSSIYMTITNPSQPHGGAGANFINNLILAAQTSGEIVLFFLNQNRLNFVP